MHLVRVNAPDAHHALVALVHALVIALVDVTEHVLVDVVINVTVDARHPALHVQANALVALVALDVRLSALDVKYLVPQAVISHVLPDVRRHVRQDAMVVLLNALARVLSLVKSFVWELATICVWVNAMAHVLHQLEL